jgi:hypothetical protein
MRAGDRTPWPVSVASGGHAPLAAPIARVAFTISLAMSAKTATASLPDARVSLGPSPSVVHRILPWLPWRTMDSKLPLN